MKETPLQNVDKVGNRVQEPIRYDGEIRGRCYLEKWHGSPDRHNFLPFCVTRSIMPDRLVFICQQPLEPNQRAFVWLDGIGVVRGQITRVIGGIAHMDVVMSANDRARLTTQILWLERKKSYSPSDKRTFPRYQPKDPASSVTIGDEVSPVMIANVSPTGAAIMTDLRPPTGTRVELGKIIGDVVRHIEYGFGMQFLQLQDPFDLEALLAPIAPAADAMRLSEMQMV